LYNEFATNRTSRVRSECAVVGSIVVRRFVSADDDDDRLSRDDDQTEPRVHRAPATTQTGRTGLSAPSPAAPRVSVPANLITASQSNQSSSTFRLCRDNARASTIHAVICRTHPFRTAQLSAVALFLRTVAGQYHQTARIYHLIMAVLCNRGPLYFCPVISIYRLLSFFLA